MNRRRRGPPPFIRFAGCALLAWITFAAVVGVISGAAAREGIGAVIAITVILIGLVWAFFARMGRGFWRAGPPLSALSDAARRIEAGDYSARARADGPMWVRSMARAFNSMSEQLEATDRRRRGFLADLAHELRTPLAVIRAQAEAINDGVHPADAETMGAILDATRTMEALVTDLRTLAESDAGALSLDREPIDAAELIGEAAAVPPPAGVGVSSTVEPGLPPLDADADRVRRVLANLVANAFAHTAPGGTVRLSAERAGGEVAITVADDGEGMEPALAARAFERFAKGPGSRGSGLGLAIAKDVVEAHGGTIAMDTAPGRGTRVRFTLPVAD